MDHFGVWGKIKKVAWQQEILKAEKSLFRSLFSKTKE